MNNSNLFATTTLCATLALAPGVALGDEEREVGDFSKIAYALPFSVEFVAASEPYVKFEGDDSTIEEITTEVDGETLKLRKKDSWFDWSDGDVEVTIGYTELNRIAMAGSGDGFAASLEADEFEIVISGAANLHAEEIKADELSVSVSGAGDVEVDEVSADEVSTKIAGSGSVELAGRSVSQSISIAGSGDHRAAELKTQDTSVKIAGSGDIQVWAESQLNATIAGSGDIEYYGSPDVNERIAGSGDITRVGDAP